MLFTYDKSGSAHEHIGCYALKWENRDGNSMKREVQSIQQYGDGRFRHACVSDTL